MISFRYHVVSLVAVLLALAAGVALGSGPLQRADDPTETGSGDRALSAAQARLAEQEEALAFAEVYADATARDIAGRSLNGRAVSVVTLPGADDAVVSGLLDRIAFAGGRVAGSVTVSERLLDAGNRQLVAELAAQLLDSGAGDIEIPAGASGYERMGLLLARAIATGTPGGQPVDKTANRIFAGLTTADLVSTEGEPAQRGSLVVLVAGPPYGNQDTREGAGAIVASLAKAVDSRSDGVVLLGPLSATSDGGLVGALRDDPTSARQVSSVDVADVAGGTVVTVLALAEQTAGGTGHYGSSAAPDGPLPGASGTN